jgi:hypothetical protein
METQSCLDSFYNFLSAEYLGIAFIAVFGLFILYRVKKRSKRNK